MIFSQYLTSQNPENDWTKRKLTHQEACQLLGWEWHFSRAFAKKEKISQNKTGKWLSRLRNEISFSDQRRLDSHWTRETRCTESAFEFQWPRANVAQKHHPVSPVTFRTLKQAKIPVTAFCLLRKSATWKNSTSQHRIVFSFFSHFLQRKLWIRRNKITYLFSCVVIFFLENHWKGFGKTCLASCVAIRWMTTFTDYTENIKEQTVVPQKIWGPIKRSAI